MEEDEEENSTKEEVKEEVMSDRININSEYKENYFNEKKI